MIKREIEGDGNFFAFFLANGLLRSVLVGILLNVQRVLFGYIIAERLELRSVQGAGFDCFLI